MPVIEEVVDEVLSIVLVVHVFVPLILFVLSDERPIRSAWVPDQNYVCATYSTLLCLQRVSSQQHGTCQTKEEVWSCALRMS